MPATTYLTESEYTAPTSCDQINAYLKEIHASLGKDYRVSERTITRHYLGLFKSTKIVYTVYYPLEHGEYQIVNFYSPSSGTSINHEVEAPVVMGYLYGLLTGYLLGTNLPKRD